MVDAVARDDCGGAVDALDGKGKADASIGGPDVIEGGLGEAIAEELAGPIIVQLHRLEESREETILGRFWQRWVVASTRAPFPSDGPYPVPLPRGHYDHHWPSSAGLTSGRVWAGLRSYPGIDQVPAQRHPRRHPHHHDHLIDPCPGAPAGWGQIAILEKVTLGKTTRIYSYPLIADIMMIGGGSVTSGARAR